MPQGVRARHDGAEIKSEPVHVHLADPVAQAVQDEAPYEWVVAVDGVPAAAVVVVLPLRRQHVVYAVVQAPACMPNQSIPIQN